MSGAELRRSLSAADAVVIGVGSMLGAGVFVVFAPAAQVAGAGLLIGLLVAAAVAYCNAVSTARLATIYPTSGGAYVYGREVLGDWWGYLAGWGFLVGKTASCAAMALTFAAYAVPAEWQRPTAVVAVLALGAVNLAGITRTARLTRWIVFLVVGCLTVAVLAGLLGAQPSLERLQGSAGDGIDWRGIPQAASLLFFAFAGYARIATLGEEVSQPERTIPWAIRRALLITVLIYAVVAVMLLSVLGPEHLAAASNPVAEAVATGGWHRVEPVVRVGAGAASLGALLALMTGIGRTSLAMARHGDLPGWLAVVHPGRQVPQHAEIALVVVVCLLVATTDLRGAIGFSSFGVLVYYLVANVAAWRRQGSLRGTPRALHALGAAGCVLLALSVPGRSLLAGILVLVGGVVLRLLRRQVWRT